MMKHLSSVSLFFLAILFFPPTSQADFFADQDFDGADLAVFSSEYNSCGSSCDGDFASDGDVDRTDLEAFAWYFGRTDCPVPDAIAEIGPEGGVLEARGGQQLEIPSGALLKETVIGIRQVDTALVGTTALSAVQLEPNPTELETPGFLRFPLPEDWNEYDAPVVIAFPENDPGSYVDTGVYATVVPATIAATNWDGFETEDAPSSTPMAKTPVYQFNIGMGVAQNCHDGTIKTLLFQYDLYRSCFVSDAINKVRSKYQHITGLTIPIPGPQKNDYPNDATQAILNTFFVDVGEFKEDQPIGAEYMNKILDHIQAGRIVVVAFESPQFVKSSDSRFAQEKGFYQSFKHTAIFEKVEVNGQQVIRLRNTPNVGDKLCDELTAKYGDCVFWWPFQGSITADELNLFRNQKSGVAVELELRGKPETLFTAPLSARSKPWTAIRFYVEKAGPAINPCEDHPSVEFEKTAYLGLDGGNSCPGTDAVEIDTNNKDVTYCFEVKNTGNTYFSPIMINDADLGITTAELNISPFPSYESSLLFQTNELPLPPVHRIFYYHEVSNAINLVNTAAVVANPSDEKGNDLAALTDQTAEDTTTVSTAIDLALCTWCSFDLYNITAHLVDSEGNERDDYVRFFASGFGGFTGNKRDRAPRQIAPRS